MNKRLRQLPLKWGWWWLWLSLLCLITAGSVYSGDDGDGDADVANEVYFRRTRNAAHLPKRKEKSFFETPIEKRTNRRLNFSDVVKRSKRNADTDVLAEACKHHVPRSMEPLKCYHCKSSTKKEKEPVCDHKLWKYLKHSEKTRLRETCDLEAKFCAKIIQQKLGERITSRGCFSNETIVGPGKRLVAPQIGCIASSKNGYRQILCLCNSDFCNVASEISVSAFNLLLLCLPLLKIKLVV